MIDISKMRVFACVAELGSITKAALLLDTTQSAVSRQINMLERELGGRLFQRTGRGMALTELGKRVEPRVRAVLVEMDRISAETKAMAGIPAGDVYIGMLTSIAPKLATRLLHEARRHCPEVRMHLYDGFSGRLNELLAEGRLDMALLFRYEDAMRDDVALGTLHSYLVGPPNDPAMRKATFEFQSLDGLALALPMFPNGIRVALDRAAREQGVTISVGIESDSIPVQLALAALPDEPIYAIASYYAIAEAVSSGTLGASRLVAPGIERSLTLAYSPRRPSSLATRQIAAILAQLSRELIAVDPLA